VRGHEPAGRAFGGSALHPTTLLNYGFVGSLVVAYVAARAILVPFAHDEAAQRLDRRQPR
jgi:hypothetical protein